MRVTDVRAAVLLGCPVIRVTTDEGIDGFAQMEPGKASLRYLVPTYARELVGADPTDVERCVARIRPLGGFKPWGAIVSAIEVALWDIAGKAAGLPVHKLLGGKVRDHVRAYHPGGRPIGAGLDGAPERYAKALRSARDGDEGFTILKASVGFHGPMAPEFATLSYGGPRVGLGWPNGGPVTRAAVRHVVECVAAMKDVVGQDTALALDMGPGWTVPDAVTVLTQLERFDLLWAEDMLTGDHVPWAHAEEYLEVTRATSVPTSTGEQIYLRHNFRGLIETRAVRIVGPDPLDVGGIAELKRVAEYADLHGVGVAPHGVLDGVFGLAALVQCCATLPDNFVAFECPRVDDQWRRIVVGLPERLVESGFVPVWDRPGLGVDFDRDAAAALLSEEDAGFFS